MAQQKTADSSLLPNFGRLFFICKIFGIYPHSLEQFRKRQALVGSKVGQILVIVSMVVTFTLYNLLIYSFSDEDKSLKAKQSTLTFVIGLFLNYIGPAMMIVDQITAILNQSKIGILFDRIQVVDERLRNEEIPVSNVAIKKRIDLMLAATFAFEFVILIATLFVLIDYTNWISLLWIVSSIPTLFSTLDKIWFSCVLYGLKARFCGINTHLEEIVENHIRAKKFQQSMDMSTDVNLGYLHKEIFGNTKSALKGNKIGPVEDGLTNSLKSFAMPKTTNFTEKSNLPPVRNSILTDIPKIDVKLNNLCQMHDEICEIGKYLNELWSLPILILMAYGFLIFTAQLYFLYCGTQGQPIPSLFRSAKNAIITTLFLIYTSGKCVYLIFLSWQTSLESKRTGICLHKCGVAADNNALHEIVTGGITSYLIILIQFNLAAQQAKEAIHASFATSANNTDTDLDMMANSTFSPE